MRGIKDYIWIATLVGAILTIVSIFTIPFQIHRKLGKNSINLGKKL